MEEVSLGTAVLSLLVPSLVVSTGASDGVASVVIGALLFFNFSVVAIFLSRIAFLQLRLKGWCGCRRINAVVAVNGETAVSGLREADLEAQWGAGEGVQQPHLNEGTPGGGHRAAAGVLVVGAPRDIQQQELEQQQHHQEQQEQQQEQQEQQQEQELHFPADRQRTAATAVMDVSPQHGQAAGVGGRGGTSEEQRRWEAKLQDAELRSGSSGRRGALPDAAVALAAAAAAAAATAEQRENAEQSSSGRGSGGSGGGGGGGAVSRKKKKVLQGAATQQVRGTVAAAALCFAFRAYGSRNLGRF